MAANEDSSLPPVAKSGLSKELTTRIASAIVMIPLALVTAYWGGWAFALFWLAAGIAMMVEWTNMTRIEPLRLVQTIFGVGLAALTALFLWDGAFSALVLTGLAFLLAGSLLARESGGKLWGALGFAYAAVIVLVPPIVREHSDLGLVGLDWMFAVVWVTMKLLLIVPFFGAVAPVNGS